MTIHIDSFWAGVIVTLGCELAAVATLIVYWTISYANDQKKQG